MISEENLENAGLYALDLLPPEERQQFERQLRIDPGLEDYVEEMRETSAAVALTAPPATPSPQVLADVLARVSGGQRPGRSFRARLANFPWGWAAAACLAVSLLLLSLSDDTAAPSTSSSPHSSTPGAAGSSISVTTIGTAGENGGTLTPETLLDRLEEQLRVRNGLGSATPHDRREALTLIQDVDRLRDELSALRRANESRYIANPQLARTVVVEMRSPDQPATAAGENAAQVPLSDRVGDFIATAIEDDETSNQPPPQTDQTTSASESPTVSPGSDPAPETVPSSSDGTSEQPVGSSEPTIAPKVLDASELTEAFKELVPGIVYNQDEGTLWVQSSDPGIYVEEPLPAGFDYDEFEDYAEQVTAPGSSEIPAPADTTTPRDSSTPGKPTQTPGLTDPLPPSDAEPYIHISPVEPVREAAAETEEPLPPVSAAYSIFEETTGKGSVVVANLPPLDTGASYQLWLENSADGKLVNVGTLPEVPAPVERFDFTLDTSGISPAGFVITRERSADAQHPSTDIVLQGP